MKIDRHCFARLLLAGAITLACGTTLASESYPQRPITLVTGYAPGGTTDAVARAFAEAMATQLKTSLIVENVPGAGGALGAYKAAKANPDGYTLLVGGDGELVTTKLLNPKQPYDGIQDFRPIGMIARMAGVLVASRQSGVKSTDEFIKALRSKPGKYNYASTGVGNLFHFAGETIRQRTRTTIAHVPYKSIAAITTDIGGGSVEFAFMGSGTAKSYIEAGLVVPLGVTSAMRLPLYPEVPALAEHPELLGFDVAGWFALMAPKGLPDAVASRLQAALKGALQDPRFRKTIESMGGQMVGDAENLPKQMREDTVRYKRLVDSLQLVETR